MTIVSLLRVKNGQQYLERLFSQLVKISDKILVLDDGSTDATGTICNNFGVPYRRYEREFNGGRDRIELHEWAKEYHPDWCITLDADELFEEEREGELRELLERTPNHILSWSFPFFYLWGIEQQYRVDGQYKEVFANRIFRYREDWKPRDVVSHSTASPPEVLGVESIEYSSIRIKHFGYMTPEERVMKYKYYTTRDKDPHTAGAGSATYDHIVKEDVVCMTWPLQTTSICFLLNFPISELPKRMVELYLRFPIATEFIIGCKDLDIATTYLLQEFCIGTFNVTWVVIPSNATPEYTCLKKATGQYVQFIDAITKKTLLQTTKENWLYSQWNIL